MLTMAAAVSLAWDMSAPTDGMRVWRSKHQSRRTSSPEVIACRRFAAVISLTGARCARLAPIVFNHSIVRHGALTNPVSSLSGGNQQKLVFAREIAIKPGLLVVSQPTRGVDLLGIAAIHDILRKFRDDRGAVLFVSEELDELLDLSDRIYVMAGGRIVGERTSGEAGIADIGSMMLMQDEHA